MSVVELISKENRPEPIGRDVLPVTMRAAVYRGNQKIGVETVPTPSIGPGELLIEVRSCGVCHTDLKKVEYDLLPPPRIYGHETAGVVAGVGAGVQKFRVGDPVVAFHHVPCKNCFYCQRRLYAQCPGYKKVGITAGFEPAGGGFAQYVRAMDWIVERGIERIPEGVSFDQACWVEPVNTCMKGIELLQLEPQDVVAVLGQGPIGLIFTLLAKRKNASVLATDTIPYRRELSEQFGAQAFHPVSENLAKAIATATEGRGVDAVIVATNAKGLVDQALSIARPGAKVLLFAQTSKTERVEIGGADICVAERMLLGSYSSDIDLQAESARLVFSGELPLSKLISHRFSLEDIQQGVHVAQTPGDQSLKVVIHPQVHS